MNIQQLTRLRNDLLTAHANIELAIIEVRLATEVLLATEAMRAPGAGLVVVSQPYCMWMSVTDFGLFCEWDYRWMVAEGWRYTGSRIVFSASGWMSHEVNISPSHLTIAAGRGEGEVGIHTRASLPCWYVPVAAGFDIYAKAIAMWDAPLCSLEAFAYNHDYAAPAPQWWHPDESTAIDLSTFCRNVGTMTWRAA